MKLSVAWFNVNDFEQAKKFYGSVLGLKKSFEMDGWAEFNGGGQDEAAVGISTGQYTPKEHGATIVLRVDDIERERKRLESNGVKFEGKKGRNSRHGEARHFSRSFRQSPAALPGADEILARVSSSSVIARKSHAGRGRSSALGKPR